MDSAVRPTGNLLSSEWIEPLCQSAEVHDVHVAVAKLAVHVILDQALDDFVIFNLAVAGSAAWVMARDVVRRQPETGKRATRDDNVRAGRADVVPSQSGHGRAARYNRRRRFVRIEEATIVEVDPADQVRVGARCVAQRKIHAKDGSGDVQYNYLAHEVFVVVGQALPVVVTRRVRAAFHAVAKTVAVLFTMCSAQEQICGKFVLCATRCIQRQVAVRRVAEIAVQILVPGD